MPVGGSMETQAADPAADSRAKSRAESRAESQTGIVFDTASGISLEEQQEILAGINAMAEGSIRGNRLAPAADLSKVKKRDSLFPFFVNLGAVVLLVLGFVLLSLFHGRDETSIRESSATLGVTERRLIQEIRQETNRQINEKDKEINDVLSRLSAADSEYRGLQSSVESLTAEQKERAAYLLKVQDEYQNTLTGLQEEKTKIIADSQQKETLLRTQAEEKVKELSGRIEQGQADLRQSQANLGAAVEELKSLNTEHERAAMVETQMNAYYAVENDYISAGLLDKAASTLQTMKTFLSAPSILNTRSLDTRRQTHLAAIAAIEEAVAEAQRMKETASANATREGRDENGGQNEALSQALAALQAQYAGLEQKAADQEKTIAAFNSRGSEQDSLISGFQTTISELRAENEKLNAANVNQQQTLNRRDSELQSLREEKTANETVLEQLRKENSSLKTEKDNLSEWKNSLPGKLEGAIEAPEIQDQLGPVARRALLQAILADIQ